MATLQLCSCEDILETVLYPWIRIIGDMPFAVKLFMLKHFNYFFSTQTSNSYQYSESKEVSNQK
jgi:hypothetical protein